jgi:multidrug efflux pump subunit AcrA (membrane-fusion protein)
VYPQAEIRDNVVNYVAVVTFDAEHGRTLRPEMTATVRVAQGAPAEVLALPRRAVRREEGRTYVVAADGTRRDVSVGTRDETHVQVVDGVREGDEVVLPAEAAASAAR